MRLLGVVVALILTAGACGGGGASPPRTCSDSGPGGNWAITARHGSNTDFSQRGVSGSAKVNDGVNLHTNPAIHVESLYIWLNPDNFVEFGWSLGRSSNDTWFFRVFFARKNGPNTYTSTSLLNSPSNGNHRFTMRRWPTDGKYHFAYDSTWFSQTHTPANFTQAGEVAVGETRNWCDDARAHWWNLDRYTSANSWVGWTNAHRTCDTQKYYDYKGVSGDEFEIVGGTAKLDTACDPTKAI